MGEKLRIEKSISARKESLLGESRSRGRKLVLAKVRSIIWFPKCGMLSCLCMKWFYGSLMCNMICMHNVGMLEILNVAHVGKRVSVP